MYICCAWLTGVNWFTCIRIIVVFKNIENSAHISIFYGKSLGELKFGLFFLVNTVTRVLYCRQCFHMQMQGIYCKIGVFDVTVKWMAARNMMKFNSPFGIFSIFFLLELRCKQSSIAKHAQNAQKHIYCAVIDTNSDI